MKKSIIHSFPTNTPPTHSSLPQSLGSIFKVQVWHNNGGEDPSWYLSRITVHDLCTGECMRRGWVCDKNSEQLKLVYSVFSFNEKDS